KMREFVTKSDNTGDIMGHSYGTGWARWDYGDTLSVGHGGAIAGFRAQLWLVPDKQWAMVILTNCSTGLRAMSELKEWAFEREVGLVQPQAEAIELTDEQLQQHTGVYTRHDGRRTITVKDGGLNLHAESIDEDTGETSERTVDYDLEPTSEDRFRVTSVDAHGATIEFFSHPAPAGSAQ